MMNYGESSVPEQEREAINSAIAEATRETVDKLCREMIQASYSQLVSKLRSDAEQLELYELSNFPEEKSVQIYIAPNMVYAPFIDDKPQETLTMLLEHGPYFGDVFGEHLGDKLRIFIPVTDDYVYPDELEEGDLPTEMYLEFIPSEDTNEPHARYVIQPDASDPNGRLGIYLYESEADGGEQVIHDGFSDRFMQESLKNRIPEGVEVVSRLIRRLGNFDVVYQQSVNPHK